MKIFKTWITAAVLFGGLLFTACTNDDNPSGSSAGSVEEQLRKMTLREKVGQMRHHDTLEQFRRTFALQTAAD